MISHTKAQLIVTFCDFVDTGNPVLHALVGYLVAIETPSMTIVSARVEEINDEESEIKVLVDPDTDGEMEMIIPISDIVEIMYW